MGFLDRVLRGDIGESEQEIVPIPPLPDSNFPDEIMANGGGEDETVIDPDTTV